MTPVGYQILWRRFYTDKEHKDGGWMSGWKDFLNHKLYSSESIAYEAIGYIKRDTWFYSAEFKVVPLYYSDSFKSALREEIDKLDDWATVSLDDGEMIGFKRACDKIEALLDTITHKL